VSSRAVVSSLNEEAASILGNDPDAVTRRLVSDLGTPKPALFWLDLTASAAVGWMAFAIAVAAQGFSSKMIAASAIAALAIYRGLCFTHEITHLRRMSVPGFETAWNLLFGVPFLLPSFTYVGVHQDHHSLSTYGTKQDPEYLPFGDSHRMMVTFLIQNPVVLPLLIILRFLVLAPVALLWPRFHHWLAVHASSFALNPMYRRTVSASTMQKLRRWETTSLAAWALLFVLIYRGVLPFRLLLVWYVVSGAISLLNTLRVLGAHEYRTDGQPRNRQAQVSDSIDTPGGPWTELWAPVGLRYHALHHYFPGIPYHNLGIAYRRVIQGLPADAVFPKSTSPSLWRSLKKLYLVGKAACGSRRLTWRSSRER
jgi:fatty acid desaturase